MIDFSLTADQLAFQKVAHEFAQEEIKPIVAKMDRIQDPAQSVPWDVVRKAASLGFNKVMVPEEYGGLGRGCVDLCIVMEEIAAADISLAASLCVMDPLFNLMIQLSTEEQRAGWLGDILARDLYVLAIGMTEPNHGGSDMMCMLPDPNLGLATQAKRVGNEYVIHGAKSAFVTNAGPATQGFLIGARTDMSKPQMESLTLFFVPAGTPGLSLGKQTDKIGFRLANHAEVYLDDVRVPVSHRVGEEGQGMIGTLGQVLIAGPALAAMSVGLARSAFEFAVEYAQHRKTWGQPIINHQAVAMMLADMQIQLEAARLMAWKAAWTNDTQPGVMHTKGAMAKVFSTEMAVDVCMKAVNVLGGYGLTKDYPVEKYLRDAISGPIEDIHNILWRLQIAAGLNMGM